DPVLDLFGEPFPKAIHPTAFELRLVLCHFRLSLPQTLRIDDLANKGRLRRGDLVRLSVQGDLADGNVHTPHRPPRRGRWRRFLPRRRVGWGRRGGRVLGDQEGGRRRHFQEPQKRRDLALELYAYGVHNRSKLDLWRRLGEIGAVESGTGFSPGG